MCNSLYSSEIMLNCSKLSLELLKQGIDIALGVLKLVSILVVDPLLELRCGLVVHFICMVHLVASRDDLNIWLDRLTPWLCHHVMVFNCALISLIDCHTIHDDHVIGIKVAGYSVHIYFMLLMAIVLLYLPTHHEIVAQRPPTRVSRGEPRLLTDGLKDVLGSVLRHVVGSTFQVGTRTSHHHTVASS